MSAGVFRPADDRIRVSCAARAFPDRAETTLGTTAAGSATASPSGSGTPSMIRWALVPLIPKEETPARRGRPVRGLSVVLFGCSFVLVVLLLCLVGRSL